MVVLDSHDAAYAAGLIDGDGSICIYSMQNKDSHGNPRPSRSYWASVSVAGVDRRIHEWFQERFGGTIYTPIKAKWSAIQKRQGHQWQVYAQKARPLLEAIEPYLVLKREQAKLALQQLHLSTTMPSGPLKTCAMQELRDKVSALNNPPLVESVIIAA